jgi:hypothetical protein
MLASALSSFGYAEPFFLETPKVSNAQSTTKNKDFFNIQETHSITTFDEIPDGFEWGKHCK